MTRINITQLAVNYEWTPDATSALGRYTEERTPTEVKQIEAGANSLALGDWHRQHGGSAMGANVPVTGEHVARSYNAMFITITITTEQPAPDADTDTGKDAGKE